MTWTKSLDAIVAERHILEHPFYQTWNAGGLTREALQGYAAQYYKHVAAFPTYLSAIHSRTDDITTRQYLLENLNDEEMGERNHPELWLRFAEGVGASRDEVRGAAALPETAECDRVFREIVTTASPAAALAALYAYESMVPAVAETKIEGLKAHYGVTGERELDFFTTHIAADEWHAQVARDLLAAAPEEVRAEAEDVTRRALDALWTLLDGVVRVHLPEAA